MGGRMGEEEGGWGPRRVGVEEERERESGWEGCGSGEEDGGGGMIR